MSVTFKKIDKEFCITDNSVNVYKYRCLTEGLQLDEVKKNPIGYYLHGDTEEFPREAGVLVRWEDFRIDGDKVFAKPCINLSHPRGQRTVDEVVSGFLNAASVGKIQVFEASGDAEMMLSGQENPTVTKWFPREISLVDIPGNYAALANLYDKDNNELNLADFKNSIIKNTMSNNTLAAATILTALNLKDGSETEVVAAINNLVDKANKSDEFKTGKEKAEKEVQDLKAESVKKEVQDLCDKGQTDKKLTNEMVKQLSASFATDPEGLKNLIDAMPAQVSVTEEQKNNEDQKEFEGKTWDDLYASNKLEGVRKKFPDLYAKLRDEKYPELKD
ncbi:phage protease [Chryseobacterium sp.]|uniref:phage protease n=1 Tax=Chryseobacterium sp. TaxID=1871047 RepID=UPI00289BFC89|nr:phage protease [Chryseobacterium sp.]